MNIKKLDFLHEIITEQMNHWLLYPAALTVMELTVKYMNNPGPNIVLWALCGLLPFLYYMVRERIRRFVPFVLLHFVLAASAFLLAPFMTTEFFLCAVCGVGYMIHSFMIGLKTDRPYTEPIHPAAGLLVSAICIMLLHNLNIRNLDTYFVIALVCVLALYAMTLYIRQYLAFLSVNESSAGYLPVSEMFRSGFGLVTGYALFGTVVLLLCGNAGNYDFVWEAIKKWLMSVLRYLAPLFRIEETEQDMLTEAETAASELVYTGSDSPALRLFWRIMEIVGLVALTVALIIFLVFAVVALVRFLRARFSHFFAAKSRTPEIADVVDVREKCGTSLKESSKRRSLSELMSPEQRIRRLYKKHILASASVLTEGDARALRLLTPKECGQRLKEEQMAAIYEQTRYSGREATQETLRRMKIALRNPRGDERER